MKLTERQKHCRYCHNGWFGGLSIWQHCKVLFDINDDGTLETFVDGNYGYVQGMKVCPFCKRPLGTEEKQ